MDSAKKAGRTIGILLLIQGVLGATVNFGLLAPGITGASSYLANAAANANRYSLAALLMLFVGVISIAISTTAWAVFKRHSERLALAYFGLGVAALALGAVESASVMSMLTLSKQYVDSTEVDARLFEVVGAVVRYGRYWAHYTHLLLGCFTVFIFYSILFRFALVPRVLVGIGMLAVLLQMTGLIMPFFGSPVNFYLLAPMGLCHLALTGWLIVKGFRDAKVNEKHSGEYV
ncbi:MAG TPA: DUF4386 domain-containing protein [Pyrinomonadaceae bacterium]|nr:DUF4386 domain-containing protein [Pyrinomonadaceae bacterium]